MAATGTPSLFRKIKTRSALPVECKQIVLNVYCMLRQDSKKSILSIVEETARLTGVSKSTVWNWKSEAKNNEGRPKQPRRALFGKAAESTPSSEHCDDFTLSAIRRKVHSFFRRGEPPTALKVLEEINGDPDLPSFKLTKFRSVLHDIGFVYKKRSRNSALIDREDIQLSRRRYLRDIRHFRHQQRTIYYLDETWVGYVWQDTGIKSSKQAKQEELTCGLPAPSGKGERLIITHAGSEEGFVKGAAEVFVGKKIGDYHDEMNGPHFEKWFTSQLLPNIKPNSVIVMDNASYHSVKLEKVPTTRTRKAEIQEWLTSKNIEWSNDMIIRELLELVKSVRHKYDGYRIDEIARLAGHTVLRLPPYHCELNPIEMVWGHVKNRVAKSNKTFSMTEVQERTWEALQLETPEMWKNSVDHVIKKEEDRFWELDGLMDTYIDPFIISVNTSSSDSESTCESGNEESFT